MVPSSFEEGGRAVRAESTLEQQQPRDSRVGKLCQIESLLLGFERKPWGSFCIFFKWLWERQTSSIWWQGESSEPEWESAVWDLLSLSVWKTLKFRYLRVFLLFKRAKAKLQFVIHTTPTALGNERDSCFPKYSKDVKMVRSTAVS